jgi:hypothetical protein
MIIVLSILSLVEFAIIFYLAGKFFALLNHARKDINAIATRLRAIEDTSQVHYVSNAFRLSVLEKSVNNIGDTGFNLKGL